MRRKRTPPPRETSSNPVDRVRYSSQTGPLAEQVPEPAVNDGRGPGPRR